MKSEKIVIEGENIDVLHKQILEKFRPQYYYHANGLYVYLYEQQFIRINSNLLSVLIVKIIENKRAEIEFVSGGGGDQMDNDWGAESKSNKTILKDFVEISVSNSWRVLGIDMEQYNNKSFSDKIAGFIDKFRGE